MKLIAHRALLNGPNPSLENSPDAVSHCLAMGIDVEIDLWHQNQTWFLGHDCATYEVSTEFVAQKGLWIHAKNHEACGQLWDLMPSVPHLNYFWHESDERTLTSQNFWWTFPEKSLCKNSIAVMPEWHLQVNRLRECLTWSCAGICTDWLAVIR